MLLEYVPPDPDDERLAELFAADADTYGRPSLFARTLAHNPDVLAARQAYVDALTDAVDIDRRTVELAYTAVAAANDCEYCVASHSEQLVEHVGLDEDTVAALAAGEERGLDDRLDERERAVVRVARQVGSDPKRLSTDHVETLRSVGFDDETVVGLVTVASAGVAATTVADALDIHPADEGGPSAQGTGFHEN
jgi:uncharacterized peroxidase-related enzyme